MTNPLVKRTECWVYTSVDYGMRCDKCLGTNIAWSEYEGHIWCYACKVDTVGEGWPLDLTPWETAKLVFGPYCFHKVRLADGVLLVPTFPEGSKGIAWVPELAPAPSEGSTSHTNDL